MFIRFKYLVITVAVLTTPHFSLGGESQGYVAAEGRYFLKDPLYMGQSRNSGSLAGWFEFYHDSEDGDQRFAASFFGRIDSDDDERSHFDLREFYWWQNFDNFEMYFGIRKIFWGVTESTHLVDIINQDDLLENFDGEDKLGQPMMQLVSQRDWGLLEFFVLPGFREKQYPGAAGRLRPELPIIEEAGYQSSRGDKHIDYAFRWSHYFDVFDISLSHFSGTNRDPYFTPFMENGQLTGLRANYSQIEQSGLALQATIDAWLFKLEAISLMERSYGRNSAAVLGTEYTWFGVRDSNVDVGLVAENQWDDRSGAREQLAQNDLALGLRWAFNDIDGSEILALVNQDLEEHNRFFSMEMSRRLNDNWKIELEARVFSRPEPETLEYQLRNDDYFQFEFRRYF